MIIHHHSYEHCPGPSCPDYMKRNSRHTLTVGDLPGESPAMPAFGSSAVYPSKVAGYGAEGLMAMAGTLAEQTEATVENARKPIQGIPSYEGDWKLIAQSNAGITFAVLALTQAVRDLPEQIVEILARELREFDATRAGWGGGTDG